MESFPAYVRLVRKRGPQPFWTPVAPLHRLVSYLLSYVYVLLRMTPFAVTLWGLVLALAGFVLLAQGFNGPWIVGIALVNLGVIHDACDGEVARYRIHHKMQSIKTYRVGMFSDFWAYAILVQALLPAALGYIAWRQGGHVAFAWAGFVAMFLLLSSYVVGFGQKAYWPDPDVRVVDESFSFASGGSLLIRILGKAYFYVFETAMFTTHATIVLVLWGMQGGTPAWVLAYVAFVQLGIGAAFLLSHLLAFRSFDRRADG